MNEKCNHEFSNGSLLKCQLDEGHEGHHQEEGAIDNMVKVRTLDGFMYRNANFKYTIQWGEQKNKALPVPQVANKNIFRKLIKRIGLK